jgi:RNA polymerase sigma factor (TIGR02999 family)
VEERPRTDITQILLELGSGEGDAQEVSNRLFRAVYDELRIMAGHFMRRERKDHTLQPTALVHEAYLKLVDQSRCEWENRAHFFGVAARAMRQILVDHARRHRARKRGGTWQRITLDENLQQAAEISIEILALDEALEKLAREDERAARVAELRIFTGMIAKDVAFLLGISKRTADADWKLARMWLTRELADRNES